jgi:flagellar biosynthesis/type III secretory pathway M-ring protein FliF/YscJ
MNEISTYFPMIFWILIIVVVWIVIRRILLQISDKINNAEVYKENTLKVLEEIRDELKELNRNNSKSSVF